MSDDATVIKIGGAEIRTKQDRIDRSRRMSILVWGPSGVGKTTLACTAPGKKLLVSFDPDGDASVADRDDVDVLDLSSARHAIVTEFKSDTSPLGLAKVIEDYDTIIVDSLTNAQHKTVMHAIGTLRGATIEKPSMEAYGTRNALITQLVKNTLMLTAKHNKHVIFIAHEASPDRDKEGVVIAVTVALGGQLVTSAPVDFSEVWNMQDTKGGRRITIRPARMRTPCKTRMFVTDKEPEFPWKHTGTEIADWYEQWRKGGWAKVPLPK